MFQILSLLLTNMPGSQVFKSEGPFNSSIVPNQEKNAWKYFIKIFQKRIIFFADSGLSNPSTKFLNPRLHWSTGKQLKPNSLGESSFFWEGVLLLAMPAQNPDCQLGLFKKWGFWWGYLLWLFESSLSSAQWHWLRYIW